MSFRDKGLFSTSSGTSLYDIRTELDNGSGEKILASTLRDRDIVNELQYHLLEPANNWSSSTSWSGTEMFSMADLVQAVQRRRNQFLLETGQIISATKFNVMPGVAKISLPDTTIDVRRVAWIDVTGSTETSYTGLWRVDNYQLSQLSLGWNLTQGVPGTYTIAALPETYIELAPSPISTGKIHVLSVETGANLDVTTGTLLGVMDDFAHVIKWGALADLLAKDGPARDESRAQYCEQRWQEGLALAGMEGGITHALLNGTDATICSTFDLDSAYPTWQSTSGAPEVIALNGANLLALYPVPDGIYSVVLDVVRNAVVPSVDGDYLQVGREYLDTILDYAQHLAAFKQGGKEFKDSTELYKRFIRAATRYNGRLKAAVPMFDSVYGPNREEVQRPRVEAANG